MLFNELFADKYSYAHKVISCSYVEKIAFILGHPVQGKVILCKENVNYPLYQSNLTPQNIMIKVSITFFDNYLPHELTLSAIQPREMWENVKTAAVV